MSPGGEFGKEQYGICNILRLKNLSPMLGRRRHGSLVEDWRIDFSWKKIRYPDSVLPFFFRRASPESGHPEFRCVVGSSTQGILTFPRDRVDHYDQAILAGSHSIECQPHAIEGTGKVYLNDRIPILA